MLKRTLVFSSPMILSLKNQQLVIAYKDSPDEKRTIPIEDIGVVLLENQQTSITLPLESAHVHIRRVKSMIPEKGHVSVLSITDKQYSNIIHIWGSVEKKLRPTPLQLDFF